MPGVPVATSGPPAPAPPDLARPGRFTVLALVTAAHTLGSVSALAVAPLAPFLLDAFDLSRAQVGWFLPSLYLGGVVTSLPAGWLTDRLGVRRTLVLGQSVTGTMVALAALSPSFPVALGFLLLAGLGWSVINPTTGRAVMVRFPPRERGMAMGVKQTGLTLGGIAAAVLLPPIAVAAGWRAALGVAGTASLVSALLVWLTYPRPVDPAAAPRAAGPGRDALARVLARPGVVVLLVSGFAFAVAQGSLLAYLVLYATEALGFSVIAAARLLALAQAGGTAARLGWGVASDALFAGRRRPGLVVTASLGAAVYVTFAVGGATAPPLAVPLAVLAGAGAFGWMGLYLALVAEVGGPRHAGMLTGVAVACAWSGILVGPPVFGLLLEESGGYGLPWLALALLAVGVGIALASLRPLVVRP